MVLKIHLGYELPSQNDNFMIYFLISQHPFLRFEKIQNTFQCLPGPGAGAKKITRGHGPAGARHDIYD